MANIPRIGLVKVELLQADMKGCKSWLPFKNTLLMKELKGSEFLSEAVSWGEIWIKDRSKRAMLWSGHVRDGKLYVKLSGQKGYLSKSESSKKVSSKLPIGNYRIWLDAWVQRRKFRKEYEEDVFTQYGKYGSDRSSLWSAPRRLPPITLWEKIKISRPRKGKPCRIFVNSRRYHWLYRLSRIIDVLDDLIQRQFELISEVAGLRNYFQIVEAILWSSYLRNRSKVWHNTSWKNMFDIARTATEKCDQFMGYGYGPHIDELDALSWAPFRDRQHINNLAELIWKIVTNEYLSVDLKRLRSGERRFGNLAEEHSILISRIPKLMNKIPATYKAVERVGIGVRPRLQAVSKSKQYGQMFAKQFSESLVNKIMKNNGKPVPFPRAKPIKSYVIPIFDAMRKYGINALDQAFIGLSKVGNFKDLMALTYEMAQLGGSAGKATKTIALVAIDRAYQNPPFVDFTEFYDKQIKLWESHGELDLAKHVRKMKATDLRYSLKNDSIFKDYKQRIMETDGKIRELRKSLEETDDLKSALKSSGKVKAIYALQTFEVIVRGLVVFDAWSKFSKSLDDLEAVEHKSSKHMAANATMQTTKLAGSIMQHVGLGDLLKWRKVDAKTIGKIGKIGKGLAIAGDVADASLYSYMVFQSESFKENLLQKYTPSVAVAMYGWHMVKWGGKWLEAVGNYCKLAKGVGLLFQAISEVGMAFTGLGRDLERPLKDIWNRKVLTQQNTVARKLDELGYSGEFLSNRDHDDFIRYCGNFSWKDYGPTEEEYLQFFPSPPIK